MSRYNGNERERGGGGGRLSGFHLRSTPRRFSPRTRGKVGTQLETLVAKYYDDTLRNLQLSPPLSSSLCIHLLRGVSEIYT